MARTLGKFFLHDKLAEGGYSSVYKCTDQIGIRYACKVLPKDANKRSRVSREVAVMEALKFSPKIVSVVDAFEDDDAFYIVQEWCRGGSVQQYVQSHPNYGENTAASILRGALRGLVHMHDKNILHMDIKASNIMLGDTSEDANVKLGDMGTAMFMPSGAETISVDELVGTIWFMSPESLSHNYHKVSDVWSIGVLAYQLLTGMMPFNDVANPITPNVVQVCKQILESEPKMHGNRWQDISEDAKSFVSSCLQKDFMMRPTALQCLAHPWLTKTDCSDRFQGIPLACEPFRYDETAKTIQSAYP
jgi:serine/threonine protein kinase